MGCVLERRGNKITALVSNPQFQTAGKIDSLNSALQRASYLLVAKLELICFQDCALESYGLMWLISFLLTLNLKF